LLLCTYNPSVEEGETVTGSAVPAARIAINAHLLGTEEGYRRAGVSRYVHNLLTHVLREDPEGDYTVFVGGRCALSLSGKLKPARLPTNRPLVRIAWEQACQPLQLVREGIALLHSPVNVQPVFLPCKGVVTVTDLSFMTFPQAFRMGRRLYQRWFTRWSVRHADRVIAISKTTAQDVVQLFDVPADKVSVVLPGVDARYQPIGDRERVTQFRRLRDLTDRFVLFVGTLEPRKNLLTLLQAYAAFRRAGGGYKLALVGGRGWLYEPILAAIDELDLRGDVVLPGFVAEEELPLWYNAAEAFFYPSLYEGFGLPPLEAMACGTPVVVSDASSLPEVVGDAGLLLDPNDSQPWAEALERLWRDAAYREDLASQGLRRARRFSWSRMARETIAAYRSVLAGRT
jgi:glycosyltransferase involved in cell wall biosynthesis